MLLSLFATPVVDAAALGAPTSPSPRDGATAEQPMILKWSNVTFPGGLAGGYLVEVEGGFGSGRVWAAENSFDIVDYFNLTFGLLVDSEHTWRVRACFGFGAPGIGQPEEDQCGPWSNNGDMWTFTPTLAKPKLLSPANTLKTAITKPVTLTWEKVIGADHYRVVISKTSGLPFTKTWKTPIGAPPVFVTDPSFIALQLNESYTWQVLAVQGKKIGPASDLWKFFVALPSPEPVHPKDKEIVPTLSRGPGVTIDFEWTDVGPERGFYRFDLFQNDIRIPPIVGKLDTRLGSYDTSISATVALNLVYEWQVTACDQAGFNCGPTGGPWTFRIVRDTTKPRVVSFNVLPKVPTWISDQSPDQNMEFSWRVTDEQGGSNLKEVQIWRSGNLLEKTGCQRGDEGDEACGWNQLAVASAPENSQDWDFDCVEEDSCLPFSLLDDGIYWVGIHVKDNANNEITETQAGKRPIKVQVDRTPPTIVTFETDRPADQDPILVTAQNPTLKIHYQVLDTVSGLQRVELWKKVQGKEWGRKPKAVQTISGANPGDPRSGDFTETFDSGVEETYNYRLRVTDQAGNNAIQIYPDDIVVDTKAPKLLSCEVKTDVDYSDITEEGILAVLTAPIETLVDAAGVFESFLWEFGDGKSGEKTAPDLSIEHRYKPGSYTATLQLEDKAGNTSKICSVKVDVDDDKPSIQEFTVDPEVPDWVNDANREVKIFWHVKDSGDSGLAWVQTWRADVTQDCAKGNEKECVWKPRQERILVQQGSENDWRCESECFVEHPFDGEYWYGIHAGDKAGNEVTESDSGFHVKKVQVDKTPPAQCGFHATPFQNNPFKIHFIPNDATRNQEVDLTFTWRFGDGSEKTGEVVEHTYTKAGTYKVTLEVIDKAGNTTECAKDDVVVKPVASPIPREVGDSCDTSVANSCGEGTPLVCQPEADIDEPDDATAGVCVPAPLPDRGESCDPTIGADACRAPYICPPNPSDPKNGVCVVSPEPGPGVFVNPLRAQTFAAVLNTVLNFLFGMSLVIAPLMILAGAFMFVTGGGNPEQVSRAKKTLIWTIIGFGVILLSKGIVFAIQNILGI